MTSRPELRQQYDLISSIQPALHVPQNWNYENSAPLFRAFMHPPHDVGGEPDVPVDYEEKEEEQWELDTYVTCEVLGWRGVWTAEERRRRADNDLGYTLYLGVPYYGMLDLVRGADARRQETHHADRVAGQDCGGQISP